MGGILHQAHGSDAFDNRHVREEDHLDRRTCFQQIFDRARRHSDGSFASPERLKTHLGLTPGSVSPFGLINDAAQTVRIVLDRDLKTASRVSFHPNINTRTYVIATDDFMRFLAATGHTVQYVTI